MYFNDWLTKERQKLYPSREKFARENDFSPMMVGRYENGETLPKEKTLIRLLDSFDITFEEKFNGYLAYCADRMRDVSKDDGQDSESEPILTARQKDLAYKFEVAFDKGVDLLNLSELYPKKIKVHKTLEFFPESFDPLIIIAGDRNDPPTGRITKATFNSVSASISDLLFIHSLDLPPHTQIITHKIASFMGREYLEEKLGQANLLTIAAPQVNLVTREVNKAALFQFEIDKNIENRLSRITEALTDLNNESDLIILYSFLKSTFRGKRRLEKIQGEVPKLILEKMKRDGKVDAAGDGKVRKGLEARVTEIAKIATDAEMVLIDEMPESLYESVQSKLIDTIFGSNTEFTDDYRFKDLGLISLAPNPWQQEATNYVSIVVGGVHGPGTSHGIRLLGDYEKIKERPLGGLFEVELDPKELWPNKFEFAKTKWITRPYTLEEAISTLNRKNTSRGSDAEKHLEFIERLIS